MASLRKEFRVATPIEKVWAALGDFGAVHTKLAPGFVADTVLEDGGGVRLVTFANGMTTRERLVTLDPAAHRVCYAIQDSPQFTHYSASAQVFEDAGGTRFVWQVDLLPDTMAEPVSGMMDAGVQAMRAKLNAAG